MVFSLLLQGILSKKICKDRVSRLCMWIAFRLKFISLCIHWALFTMPFQLVWVGVRFSKKHSQKIESIRKKYNFQLIFSLTLSYVSALWLRYWSSRLSDGRYIILLKSSLTIRGVHASEMYQNIANRFCYSSSV